MKKQSGYGNLKIKTAEAVIEKLAPVREKIKELKSNKAYLEQIMKDGMEKAKKLAKNKLKEVYDKVGLVIFK